MGLLKLGNNGNPVQLVDEQQHTGHGPHPERQDRPHPHSAQFSPDNRFVLVADLGLDRIKIYALDEANDQLVLQGEGITPPGAGPRHLAFHPNSPYLYSMNEVDSTVTFFIFDEKTGGLTPVQTLPTLPDDFEGENTTAEIAISKDGRYLYGSNRGHDSIVQYAIDPENGKLTFVERVSTEGGHPRHFALTPDGDYLIAANRDSNNLVLFRVDPQTGKLQFTGNTASASKPVCIQPVWF
ncbi:6-phosphogluconolactonase [compost metagenome]